MKLDSRILKGKKPLDCFDAENKELMKSFLNKEGYVSNNIANYCFLNKCPKRFLSNVFKEVRDCFTTHINGGNGGDWKYFLPVEWVKEPEKKYRPLSFKEFLRLFDFGDGVCFRRKGQDTTEFSMFLGYEIDSDGNRDEIPGEGKVNLGGNRYTLAELFEYYEMQLDDEWQPFGVLDE